MPLEFPPVSCGWHPPPGGPATLLFGTDNRTGELLTHAVRRAREMGFVAIDSASAGAYGAEERLCAA